ncbi:PREDICTED: uncharacterized protein LOC101314283 [Fragaria vesca subsp. vesca]|uniref:uncharacterized protein LOC101314283 n=1 Tax=Fragaria vesca subsp. vesca TaxID=101020 RepID=UPI0002C32B66|nr:PREDICTED: uncharacterized protein LOC101314283 [Fragaria vesca subsp. vesca]
MTYPSWELRKPDHGSNSARNLSNQALKEGQCRSVYFLSSLGGNRHRHAIFGVKIKGGKILGKGREFLEPVSKLFDRSNRDVPAGYNVVATRLNSPTELYLLFQNDEKQKPFGKHHYHSACTFDIMTKELKSFEPPKQHKTDALLISAYDKLYHLAVSAVEVYDPQACSWKSCSSFPHYQEEDWSSSRMTGYAICYGCILVSVEPPETCERRESPLWVYDVTLDEWSEVKVPTDDDSDFHYPFTDKAVVIDDTIYARSFEETVVAFSLMRKQMVDGSMEYSVDKPRKLHGLRTCFHLDPDCYSVSDCLVHLGGFNFCLVQSIQKYFDRQRVFITTFDIIYKEGKRRIRTLDTTMREVDISCLGQFYIESGFTLECEEGNEIVSTSSMMQPTDDPRLCKLQQVCSKRQDKEAEKKTETDEIEVEFAENNLVG